MTITSLKLNIEAATSKTYLCRSLTLTTLPKVPSPRVARILSGKQEDQILLENYLQFCASPPLECHNENSELKTHPHTGLFLSNTFELIMSAYTIRTGGYTNTNWQNVGNRIPKARHFNEAFQSVASTIFWHPMLSYWKFMFRSIRLLRREVKEEWI